MRVLTVANHLGSRGGLERTQMTNCRGLAARGHQLDLVYVSAGDFAPEWERFTRTMVQIPGTLPRRGAPLTSTLGVLRALTTGAGLSPDAVYVYRYWDLPYAAALSAFTGAPLVYHLCLPPPGRLPPWLRLALRRVDRTLSVSADTARRWAEIGLPAKTVQVVLTGIDLDTYAPATDTARQSARRDLGVPVDAFLVVYAGRIGREKGVEVLVRAFAELSSRVPDAHLLVVGSPSLGADPADSAVYLSELRTAAEGHPVTFLPGRSDVVPILQAADVAVVPSLWPEPLSRSLMEPLACGIPVVATEVGGNPEVLTGWLAANLVPGGDAGSLAAALASLHDWRRHDPELARRCREHAERFLALDGEVDQVAAALQDVAATSRRRARRRSASPTERTSCG